VEGEGLRGWGGGGRGGSVQRREGADGVVILFFQYISMSMSVCYMCMRASPSSLPLPLPFQ
jgi:hypothetical protein